MRNKILLTFFIFMGIAIALVPVVDYFLDHYVRRKNYQRLAYDTLDNKTEMIFLGSSRFAYGIEAAKLNHPSATITIPYGSYQNLAILWNHLSPKAKNIKTALVEWDVVILASQYLKFSSDFTLQSANYRFFSKPKLSDWFQNFNGAFKMMFPSLVEIRLTPRQFFTTYMSSPADPEDDFYLSPGHISSISRRPYKDSAQGRYSRLSGKVKESFAQDQLNELLALLKDFRNKNIQYRFIKMPVHPKVRDVTFPDWEKIYENARKAVIEFQGGAPMDFVNLNASEFMEEDFKDSDHMNRWGAEKFTRQLNEQLR